MVVTSKALGVWRTGLAGYRPKCLIKQVCFSLDLKDVSIKYYTIILYIYISILYIITIINSSSSPWPSASTLQTNK